MLVNPRDLVPGRTHGGGCVTEVVCAYDAMRALVVFCGRCGPCMPLSEACSPSLGLTSARLNPSSGLRKSRLCGSAKTSYNSFAWRKDVHVSRSRTPFPKIPWVIDPWGHSLTCLTFTPKRNRLAVVWSSACHSPLDVREDLAGSNSAFQESRGTVKVSSM
jgi:hypothetical protein